MDSMATPQFSYPVLKNIISYLDIQKRLQLAVCYPQLKSVERNADLKLEFLQLGEYKLNIDELISFRLPEDDEEDGYAIKIISGVKETGTKVAVTGYDQFYSKLLNLLLADRETVNIAHLYLLSALKMIERLPKRMQMECKHIVVYSDYIETLRAIRPFLTNLSIENIEIGVTKPEDPVLEHELVRGAKRLIITINSNQSIGNDISKLNNPKIAINSYSKFAFKNDDVIILVKSWLERCPEVGTQFSWNTGSKNNVKEVMDLLKDKLGVRNDNCHLSLNMRSGHKLVFIKESWNYFRMEVVEKD